MFYDLERILDEADSVTVAEFIGMEVSHRGHYNFIRCPGHENRLGKVDRRMTNAWLLPKGYICKSCGVSVDLIDMVKEFEDCDFKEAVGIIADSLGGREHYLLKGLPDDFIPKDKILSNEDLSLIGLSPSVSFDEPVASFRFKEDAIEFCEKKKMEDKKNLLVPKFDNSSWTPDRSSDVWLATRHQTISLKSLFREEPEFYYSIIKGKAKEAADLYKSWVDALSDRTSKEAIALIPFAELNLKRKLQNIDENVFKDGNIDDEILYDFKQIFNSWHSRAKEIYLSIAPEQTGEAVEEKTETETVVEKKPRFDLFL